jgi:hypothetical protein
MTDNAFLSAVHSTLTDVLLETANGNENTTSKTFADFMRLWLVAESHTPTCIDHEGHM